MELWKKTPPSVRVLGKHRTESGLFPAEHLLFQVENGTGKLRWVWWEPEIPYHGNTPAALMLGETPLALLRDSGCPTCASMLAAGWGFAPKDPILRELAGGMNAPYQGLEDALERLAPLTGLLQSAVFILSHGSAAPTDGEGRFFWDVPPWSNVYNATAEWYEHTNYRILPPAVQFLYPSQPPDQADENQVEHYRAKLRAGETLPPVLAWTTGNFGGGGMSILLDGHHRAAACALEGRQVPCLTISVPDWGWKGGAEYIIWPDGTWTPTKLKRVPLYGERRNEVCPFQVLEREDRGWSWPERYRQAAQCYPTVEEAAYLSQYPGVELTAEGIWALVCSQEYDETETAAALLDYASRQPGAHLKALALPFTGEDKPAALREAAYRALSRVKNDPEIEALFIRIYVYEEDNWSLRKIADRYWDMMSG